MFVCYYGYDFDNDGRNIPKAHHFDTLEEARSYADNIYQKTGWILGVFQDGKIL